MLLTFYPNHKCGMMHCTSVSTPARERLYLRKHLNKTSRQKVHQSGLQTLFPMTFTFSSLNMDDDTITGQWKLEMLRPILINGCILAGFSEASDPGTRLVSC